MCNAFLPVGVLGDDILTLQLIACPGMGKEQEQKEQVEEEEEDHGGEYIEIAGQNEVTR